MFVVCTAGHVDHGKSTLVRALTGMEPDRFVEERERGLTIDIGFAWTELDGLPGDRRVAFVDLPGHHRFIGNMLAGAGPVGTALFVVAADEGWMPQSSEHLAILDLLGVRSGLVAVTKADLVDDDVVEIAVELVREELRGSTLADAGIVVVSGATGEGLDELRAELAAVLAASPAAADTGRPRLWIDRSFVVHGSGTVVTGTLLDGTLRVGDEVAVVPGGHRGRVRSLQTLKESADEVPPGSRVAVNISGLSAAQCPRGAAVTHPGQWLEVSEVDAWMRVLPGQAVGRRGAWHLHAGSAERAASLATVEGVDVVAGAEHADGYVRVTFDPPAALRAGDRIVLREAGRQATVAGGVVLDVEPGPRLRGSGSRLRRLEQLARRRDAALAGDRAALLRLAAADHTAPALGAAAAGAGLTRDAAVEAARDLGLVLLGDALAGPEHVEAWAGAVAGALDDFHERHPVRRVAPKEVAAKAAAAAGCPPRLLDDLLQRLVAGGMLEAEVGGVRLPAHRPSLSPDDERAREAVLAALDAQPFGPPPLAEVAAQAGASPDLLQELEHAGEVVRLEADMALSATAVAQAHARLWEAYREEGPLTASRAREVLGTSRKYALPLLQHMDHRGWTRREGDTRIVREPAGGRA